MRKAERAAWIAERLDEWFPRPAVPLNHSDPFTLLVAVLLSAQCTDERVNRITPALFELASTPEAMEALGWKAIDALVRPCGLSPTKARAIESLSGILVREHGGKVPVDQDALERLPGVGHKTASVVMAQAFGVPSFPVDTHIHRLARTWKLSPGKNVVQTERDLKRLFPQDLWNRLHLQIIFFGREKCPSRSCDGVSCEICRICFPGRKPYSHRGERPRRPGNRSPK